MERSKLKNAAIFILVLANIFFLVLFLIGRSETGKIERARKEELLSLLSSNGISCNERLLSGELPRALSSLRDAELESFFAKALLGDDVTVSELGGGIFRYDSERGYGIFRRSGEFRVSFAEGVSLGEASLASASTLLKNAGLSVTEGSLAGQSSIPLFSFICRTGGVSVFNCQVSLVFGGGESSAYISGRVPFIKAGDELFGQPADIFTAVVRFLAYIRSSGRLCTEIQALDSGYFFSASAGGGGDLVPVWRISTDTGMYYVNALTSEITASFD